MKKLLYAIIIYSLFGYADCRKKTLKFKVQNNSNIDILYLESFSYPDTINFVYGICYPIISNERVAKPNETITPYIDAGGIKTSINNQAYKTLMHFIYNADTARKYYRLANNTCDSLRKRPDLILKRFDVTVDYLEAHNWTLVYP